MKNKKLDPNFVKMILDSVKEAKYLSKQNKGQEVFKTLADLKLHAQCN